VQPTHHLEVVYKLCTAHPSHRGLDMSLQLRYSRVELGLEVPTLDVEPVLIVGVLPAAHREVYPRW
jgi:hypothetical protein